MYHYFFAEVVDGKKTFIDRHAYYTGIQYIRDGNNPHIYKDYVREDQPWLRSFEAGMQKELEKQKIFDHIEYDKMINDFYKIVKDFSEFS